MVKLVSQEYFLLTSFLLFYALFTRVVLNQLKNFWFQCWFGGLNVKSKNVQNKVMNVCSKVVVSKLVFYAQSTGRVISGRRLW